MGKRDIAKDTLFDNYANSLVCGKGFQSVNNESDFHVQE